MVKIITAKYAKGSWSDLPDLDLDAVMECLEAFHDLAVELQQGPPQHLHGEKCHICETRSYNGEPLEHEESCVITKATAILEQLKKL